MLSLFRHHLQVLLTTCVPKMLFDNAQGAAERGIEIAWFTTVICPLKKSVWRKNKAQMLCSVVQIAWPQMEVGTVLDVEVF